MKTEWCVIVVHRLLFEIDNNVHAAAMMRVRARACGK